MEGINGSETSTFYSEMKDDSIDDQPWPIEVLQFEVPFLLAVIFIATIGNILVIVIYSKKALRKSNSALYILNLAIGDLFAVGVALFHVTEFYPSTWPFLWRYNAQCILHRWCRYTAFNFTVFLMVAMAVDRYYAVCQPIKFKTNCTLRRTKRIIGILWVLAMLFTVLQSFNFQVEYNKLNVFRAYAGRSKFACRLRKVPADWFIYLKTTYANVLLFYIPVTVTGFIYVIIIAAVWKRKHGIVKHSTSHDINMHVRTACTLCIVFIAYVSCYAFYGTFNLLMASPKQRKLNPLVKNIGLMMPFFNSCLNPFIYSFFNSTFRNHLLKMFWKRKCDEHQTKKPKTDNEHNSRIDLHTKNATDDEGSKQTGISDLDSSCIELSVRSNNAGIETPNQNECHANMGFITNDKIGVGNIYN